MGQTVVNLIRSSVVKSRMAPFVIVIIEPPAQTLPQRLTGVECVQVNVLVFEGPPQPLDEYIVLATTPTGRFTTRSQGDRAARIMEHMEREGVVGPADGARPRKVLVGSHAMGTGA